MIIMTLLNSNTKLLGGFCGVDTEDLDDKIGLMLLENVDGVEKPTYEMSFSLDEARDLRDQFNKWIEVKERDIENKIIPGDK